jgi:hypothetical protein
MSSGMKSGERFERSAVDASAATCDTNVKPSWISYYLLDYRIVLRVLTFGLLLTREIANAFYRDALSRHSHEGRKDPAWFLIAERELGHIVKRPSGGSWWYIACDSLQSRISE